MTKLDVMYQAIDEKKLVEVVVNTYEKGIVTRICIPFDYALSSRAKDGKMRYHFYDLNSPNGRHNLSVLPEQLISIKVLDKTFNPEEIVTWPTNWTYKRDWGSKS